MLHAMHWPVHEELQQMPSTQGNVLQSPLSPHICPKPHFAHAPPQSTSDSLPFMTPSEHEGTWQTPAVHTPLPQSAGVAHVAPSAHGSQTGPPQSTSVSAPFRSPSLQGGGAQVPPLQFPP